MTLAAYWLVLWLGGGTVVVPVVYTDLAHCEAAGAEASEHIHSGNRFVDPYITFTCVPAQPKEGTSSE